MRRGVWIVLTILEMATIMYLSLRPEDSSLKSSVSWQAFHKFGHLVAYGTLTYFFLQSFFYFKENKSREQMKLLWTAFASAVFFGVLNEFLQSFVPSRSARIQDVLVNAIGSGIMIFLVKKNSKFFSLVPRNKNY